MGPWGLKDIDTTIILSFASSAFQKYVINTFEKLKVKSSFLLNLHNPYFPFSLPTFVAYFSECFYTKKPPKKHNVFV